MCKRCLWRVDGDDGVDWQPVFSGVLNFRRSKRPQVIHWAALRGLDLSNLTDHRPISRFAKPEPIVYEEGRQYTDRELEQLADQMLREQAKEIDPETGKERGIGGEDPILFREHLDARKRREIYNENGVPDPHLVSGIYNRIHPNGRKVNTPEQRKKHGAAFYRG